VIIKVLGPGCANCKNLERVTREALAALGLDATVEKVEDYPTIAGYGVMSTPALVVDEQVVLSGRVPKRAEVQELLSRATASSSSDNELREQVRAKYAEVAASVTAAAGRTALEVLDADSCCAPAADAAASCCAQDVEVGPAFGAGLYSADEQGELPAEAVAASLGCGNPLMVAELRAGERVLDLGSGGGIDVLLSARRVGDTGFAYGLDMTDEMLELARANARKAGVHNVEFVKGQIEDVPLPGSSVDVVISNCVVNLSTDKPAVLAEMFRVLVPGGRIGISDVVAEDDVTPAERAERGSFVGCIAGALSRREYLTGLAAAGFVDADVTFTHELVPGMHGAVVRAVKPA
jgi:small redox-active disulfide protein 2